MPAHVARRIRGVHRPEDGELGVLQGLGVAAGGRLHRRRREHLHQVVDDDVSQRADRVVEVPPVLDAEALGHRDLHGGDVVAVPHRLEHRVGEPQVEDLVESHLPEEVVDPVDLRLVQVLVQVGGELAGGLQVVAERLLHRYPLSVGHQPGLRQALDHGREQRRRDLQVEGGVLVLAERFGDALIGLLV